VRVKGGSAGDVNSPMVSIATALMYEYEGW